MPVINSHPHPFPARMAPNLALEALEPIDPGSIVLDPMCGSGTVIRAASELGFTALGFDLDPLSVLMSKVWTTPIDGAAAIAESNRIARIAKGKIGRTIYLPWIDDDLETADFVNFWFSNPQRDELRIVAALLRPIVGPIGDVLRLALSRMVVTKELGASLARDVSHSRPHRTKTQNSYRVIDQFPRSVRAIVRRLNPRLLFGESSIQLGDARDLAHLPSKSIDAIVSSPPYLNAIDYLRGHRLSLVWLGYNLGGLRERRSHMVGAERAPDPGVDEDYLRDLLTAVPEATQLGPRLHRILERFVDDLGKLMMEAFRVLRPGGRAVYVIGDSTVRGVFVRTSELTIASAQRAGLTLVGQSQRELPATKRYLPPPGNSGVGPLSIRMRTESVLSFAKQ